MSNARYLAVHGLAFQGTSGTQNDNFYQLLKLRVLDNEIMRGKLDEEEKNEWLVMCAHRTFSCEG